jgi:TRAP-type C4-dicarboxylate transport system substrate-binding protein
MIVSTKVWESLTPEEQKWLQEAADESAVHEYKLWAIATAEAMRGLEEAGVTITYPDKELFRKAVEGMYVQLEKTQPEIYAIVKSIQEVR